MIIKNGLGRSAERVYKYITEEIAKGALQKDRRIPTQQELAVLLGISRSTVQKSIGRLVFDKVIYSIRGSGMYVSGHTQLVRTGAGNTGNDKTATTSNIIPTMLVQKEVDLERLQDYVLKKKHLLNFYFQSKHKWVWQSERDFLTQIIVAKPKALLAFCTPCNGNNNHDLLEQLVDQGTRVIHVEPYCTTSFPNQEFLIPDYEKAGFMAAVSFLLGEYRQFFMIGYYTDGPYAWLIENGYADALRKFGPGYHRKINFIDMLDMNRDSFFKKSAIRKSLARGDRPAIFARSYAMALEVVKLFKKYDFSFPKDYGLITLSMTSRQITESRFDVMIFNRQQIYESAIDTVINQKHSPLHQVIGPEFRKYGSS